MTERGEPGPQTKLVEEEQGPTQTGEYAPTITPAGSEHKDDGSIHTPGVARALRNEANKAGGEYTPFRMTRRTRLVGATATVTALVAAGVFAFWPRGDEDPEHVPGSDGVVATAPAQPGEGQTDAPAETAEPEPTETVRVLLPRIEPGEFYELPTDESSPQGIVDELCMGISAAFNSVDEDGQPRQDLLATFYSSSARHKYTEASNAMGAFQQQRTSNPDTRYYQECQVVKANPGGWGARWTVDVETTTYTLDPNGGVLSKASETEQWDLTPGDNRVTRPDGTTVEGIQINNVRPVEGWNG